MGSAASTSRRPRPGRPRLTPPLLGGSPREQVLEAAARLFASKGYAATSTREIAEAVGVRQASLYYHFAGKGEILTELLSRTIRPTMDSVARIESLADCPDTVLYLVALTDVRTLASAPHNIGWLYLAPDVAQVDGIDDYATSRTELAVTYARLAARVVMPEVLALIGPVRLGEKLVHTVEEVIALRNAGHRICLEEATWIASSCLRLCGVDNPRVELAVKTAEPLLELIDSGPV